MPKAFEEFTFSDEQKTGAVTIFWENVHLAAKALKEDTNCPNEIIASGLRAVAAEWDWLYGWLNNLELLHLILL